MDVRVGLWRKLSAKELMLLNCGVGEDSWESLDFKEIQPVHSKGDQSWVFFGRTDAKAETPVLWSPEAKSWLIGKDPDAGRYWGQKEKGTTEDEMAGWHHRLDGHEFEWTLGGGDGQEGLACCNSWVAKSRTRLSDWTELNFSKYLVGFPSGSVVNNPYVNAGDTRDTGSIPESGRSLGEGNGNPFQYSFLGNPMDRGTCGIQFIGLQKCWTWLND